MVENLFIYNKNIDYNTFFSINSNDIVPIDFIDSIISVNSNKDIINNQTIIIIPCSINWDIWAHKINLLSKSHNLCLFLHTIIFNTKIFDYFNFIIPTTMGLYLKYHENSGIKMYLPISSPNIIKLFDSKNVIDKLFSKLPQINITTNSIKLTTEPDILIYDKINLFDVNSISKSIKIIKIDSEYKNFSKIKNIYSFNSINSINSNLSNYKLDFKIKIKIEKKYTTFGSDEEYRFKKDRIYFISREGFNPITNFDSLVLLFQNFINIGFRYVGFKIKSTEGYELGILINVLGIPNIILTISELLEKIEWYDDRVVGTNINTKNLLDSSNNSYWEGGKNNLYWMIEDQNWDYYLELIIAYRTGLKIVLPNRYNKKKFQKILYFWAGKNNIKIEKNYLKQFFENNKELFEQKKILIITKNMLSYGGNQKSLIQIYKELELWGYEVKIYSPGKKKIYSSYLKNFDSNDLIYLDNINQIISHINSTDYQMVIINKLNEFMTYAKNINKKIVVLTHNSMDPFNSMIIQNSKFIHKILTVNSNHISLFRDNNLDNLLFQYVNYQNWNNNLSNLSNLSRVKFTKNILFVGRIESEKNIELLIDSFDKFNIINQNQYKLFIVGDSKKINCPNLTNNIIYLGKLDFDEIVLYLINCDYLILPSFTEGMPFVIVEAFGLGIPVITTNINGINEIVEDKINGFLFELYDYGKYKNTIDNFNIIEEQKNYTNTKYNLMGLTDCLIRAYSININEWNQMSINCINKANNNFNQNKGFYTNIYNIIEDKKIIIICQDYIDYIDKFNKCIEWRNTEINYKTYYKTIVSIINFANITKTISISSFLSKLNYLEIECVKNNYGKIIDQYGQYVLFDINKIEYKVSNLFDLFIV